MRILCGPCGDVSALRLNINIVLRAEQFCPFTAVQAELFTGRQRKVLLRTNIQLFTRCQRKIITD